MIHIAMFSFRFPIYICMHLENLSSDNAKITTLVYLLEVPPLIEVPLGKIADFKRAKMVNTS